MKCIDFDSRFEAFAAKWMEKNGAKYKHNVALMELRMPAVYARWLNKPASWLDGVTPAMYFAQYDDADMLVNWMLQYFAERVSVPDQLLERITALGEASERALIAVLDDASAPHEARLTAISLLREMESAAPAARYIAWIAAREEADELSDMAAESLAALDASLVPSILDAVESSTPAGRETFLDVLCNFPGDERIFALAMSMFAQNPDRRALFASYLGKLGDARAIPALLEAAKAPHLGYLDFVEVRNAIEALGGDAPDAREFAGDRDYELLKSLGQ